VGKPEEVGRRESEMGVGEYVQSILYALLK
jgi:hypothetical protein